MQLTYIFAELGTTLRRNVSMSIALIVTIFVSLTLVGMGLLLNSQAAKAQEHWGSRLQITVFLCNQNSVGPTCVEGEVTAEQKRRIEQLLDTHPEVASWYAESKQDAYEKFKEMYAAKDESKQRIFNTVKPSDLQESYWVKLKDPEKFAGIKSAVVQLDGVDSVQDLREVLKPLYFWMDAFKWGALGIAGFLLVAAVLQVGNTIRMAAYARRREIGIMRLVGASRAYIQMPFVLESLVAAAIGVGLAAASIVAFMHFVINGMLQPNSDIVAWIDWSDAMSAIGWIAVVGMLLALLPTLVMTRKYLKV